MRTKGNWKFNVREISTVPEVAGWITIDGIRIATVLFGDGINLNDAIDNAHFVCKAVNHHDELVEFAEKMAKYKFSFDKRDLDNGAYRDELRGLNSKAEALLAKIKDGE